MIVVFERMPLPRYSKIQLDALRAGEAEGRRWYHHWSWLVNGQLSTRSVKWLIEHGLMEVVYNGETRAAARITPEGRKALHEYQQH